MAKRDPYLGEVLFVRIHKRDKAKVEKAARAVGLGIAAWIRERIITAASKETDSVTRSAA